jgi:drug/metabolite transporter (DMT)-like permease
VTALVIMPLFEPTFTMPTAFNIHAWGIMLIVALMLISATLFVQHGITMVTATRASVIFLFELVVAAVAAYYLANEVMEWNEWLGGALIIVASMLSANNTHD